MLDAWCLMLDAWCRRLDVGCYRASSIKHQASSITHQASGIKHQSSSIKHQASSIKHQSSAKTRSMNNWYSLTRQFLNGASRNTEVWVWSRLVARWGGKDIGAEHCDCPLTQAMGPPRFDAGVGIGMLIGDRDYLARKYITWKNVWCFWSIWNSYPSFCRTY